MEKKMMLDLLRGNSTIGTHYEAIQAMREIADYVEQSEEVVRCKDCIYWQKPMVRLNDGTYRDYKDDEKGAFGEPAVFSSVGINVGSHCTRFARVLVHGFRDGRPCTDSTYAWCGEDDFCSKGKRRGVSE